MMHGQTEIKNITFLMSVHLSVKVEQLSFHGKDLCEILCWWLNIRILQDIEKNSALVIM